MLSGILIIFPSSGLSFLKLAGFCSVLVNGSTFEYGDIISTIVNDVAVTRSTTKKINHCLENQKGYYFEK